VVRRLVADGTVSIMKSFQEFLNESVNIQHVDTLIINNSEPTQSVGESVVADVQWNGNLYRMEMTVDHSPTRKSLTEKLQSDYPGAVVHNIYPVDTSQINVKSSKRYHPAKLDWVD